MSCKKTTFLQCTAWALAVVLTHSDATAQIPPYSRQTFWEDTRAVKWETGLLFGGAIVFGSKNWNWGSSHSFRTTSEGWFGPDTESGGADKLGHAFSAYLITNGLAEQLLRQGRSPERAALTSVVITQALMLGVEILDGYSVDHGWSTEDVVMNVLGSGTAYWRQVTPGVRDKLDFRLEYTPTGYKGGNPISDYAGHKYVLALKLAGFDGTRDTPLRYLELQTGYYTRGFSREEQLDGMARSRRGFIGIGLNLSELLFGQRASNESGALRGGRFFLEHIQLPATATRSEW
ncbi:MAG: DUF2279 domain-containing protein [Rhodoferax sp.]|nr:DUF2279 domain-containing protein [Rhodoferax sp.]